MRNEYQYLNLVRNVLREGVYKKSRNGNVYSLFGEQMRFSLRNNSFPLLKTKKMAWKTCMRELFWFIRGSTNNNELNEKNVHIWDANASKEYLGSIGLDYEDGELGPIYGHQWRNFNGSYPRTRPIQPIDKREIIETGYKNSDKSDQLRGIICDLLSPETRYSRRIIMDAWNPNQLEQMALPPCHVLSQFWVNPKNSELSCHLYQRSGDVGLGIPFNIASYSLLTILLADFCGLKPGEFIHSLGDVHIYEEHVKALRIQLERDTTYFPEPEIYIQNTPDVFEEYDESNVILKNYVHHPRLPMNMKA